MGSPAAARLRWLGTGRGLHGSGSRQTQQHALVTWQLPPACHSLGVSKGEPPAMPSRCTSPIIFFACGAVSQSTGRGQSGHRGRLQAHKARAELRHVLLDSCCSAAQRQRCRACLEGGAAKGAAQVVGVQGQQVDPSHCKGDVCRSALAAAGASGVGARPSGTAHSDWHPCMQLPPLTSVVLEGGPLLAQGDAVQPGHHIIRRPQWHRLDGKVAAAHRRAMRACAQGGRRVGRRP